MIDDSWIWKNELKKELDEFYRFSENKTTSVSDDYFMLRCEKFFFISAFIIRKLNEANKLSDELNSKDFNCIKYQRIKQDNLIDYLNRHHFVKFYNLEKEEKSSVKLKDFCNYLIHSFVFNPVMEDNYKLCGFFINSDKIKDKFLYYIEYNSFIELINDVINDDITDLSYNRVTGELRKSNRQLKNPP